MCLCLTGGIGGGKGNRKNQEGNKSLEKCLKWAVKIFSPVQFTFIRNREISTKRSA